MSDGDENTALVIENGSGMIKAGFANHTVPDCTFSSVVGRSRYMPVMGQNEMYVGNEAQSNRNTLTLNYPIEHGIVSNWNDMEQLWEHAFYHQLRVVPEGESVKRTVLLTESPMNPKEKREKTTEIMFEKFEVTGMYLAMSGVLALLGSGHKTGIVLDGGETFTHTLPVLDGYGFPHACSVLKLGGRHLVQYLQTMLTEQGHQFSTLEIHDGIRKINENLCYVASNYTHECDSYSPVNFTFTDGRSIMIRKELFKCPEALFQPMLLNIEEPVFGIHQMIVNSIDKCDPTIQDELYGKIILTGGTMMYRGVAARIKNELEHLVKPNVSNMIDITDGKNYTWLGGTILASTASFGKMCISQQEYDESGKSIVHRKCF